MTSRKDPDSDEIKTECLIFGYIRNIEKNLSLSYDFPEGIINIIISHYPRLDFKFKRLNGIKVSADGLTLNSEGIKHSVRFGDFLHKTEEIIFEVIFFLKKASPINVAIGFMTPEFDEQMDPFNKFNTGFNHSCCISGTGYFVNSPNDFTSTYTHGSYNGPGNLWRAGNKLHIQIDMIEQKGRMWNDNQDEENTESFEIGLPESAAIFVDVAGTVECSAIHQQFRYKK